MQYFQRAFGGIILSNMLKNAISIHLFKILHFNIFILQFGIGIKGISEAHTVLC